MDLMTPEGQPNTDPCGPAARQLLGGACVRTFDQTSCGTILDDAERPEDRRTNLGNEAESPTAAPTPAAALNDAGDGTFAALPQAPRRARTWREAAHEPVPPIKLVLRRLSGVRQSARRQWYACCPAHADRNPSLSIHEAEDGVVAMYCHAGCTCEEICDALGIEMKDLFPARNSKCGSARCGMDAGVPVPRRAEARGPQAKPSQALRRTSELSGGLETAPGSADDWAAIALACEAALSDEGVQRLAEQLGVTADSLRLLHVGWRVASDGVECYTFPEVDAHGWVLGIAIRDLDGTKRFAPGGRRGLYLPAGSNDGDLPILIVEGATDTAALVSMGLSAIGRPSATGGVELLVEALRDMPTDRIIYVLGEMDAKPDGRWPGRDGAERVARQLADSLGRSIYWALPPDGCKDVRAWLQVQRTQREEAA